MNIECSPERAGLSIIDAAGRESRLVAKVAGRRAKGLPFASERRHRSEKIPLVARLFCVFFA
jgi:hypothetical protein